MTQDNTDDGPLAQSRALDALEAEVRSNWGVGPTVTRKTIALTRVEREQTIDRRYRYLLTEELCGAFIEYVHQHRPELRANDLKRDIKVQEIIKNATVTGLSLKLEVSQYRDARSGVIEMLKPLLAAHDIAMDENPPNSPFDTYKKEVHLTGSLENVTALINEAILQPNGIKPVDCDALRKRAETNVRFSNACGTLPAK